MHTNGNVIYWNKLTGACSMGYSTPETYDPDDPGFVFYYGIKELDSVARQRHCWVYTHLFEGVRGWELESITQANRKGLPYRPLNEGAQHPTAHLVSWHAVTGEFLNDVPIPAGWLHLLLSPRSLGRFCLAWVCGGRGVWGWDIITSCEA